MEAVNRECTNWLGGEFYYDFHSRESRYKPIETNLEQLKNKCNLNFLEIGSCEGQSSLWFIKTILTHPTSKITCIDPHHKYGWYNSNSNNGRLKTDKTTAELFKLNVLNDYSEKVTYHKGTSWDILPKLKESYNVIYIDGSHSLPDVYMDGRLSKSLLRQDGMMIFDDCYFDGVKAAIQMLKGDGFFSGMKVLHQDQILILKMS